MTRVSVLLMLFILLTSACTSAMMQCDGNHSDCTTKLWHSSICMGKAAMTATCRGSVEWRRY